MAFRLAQAYVELSSRGMKTLQGALGSVGRMVKSLLNPVAMLAGGLAAAGASLSAVGMLKFAASAETAAVQFEVLLGSADKAKKMMEEINAFAVATPFEPGPLRQVAMALSGLSIETETILPRMQILGDLAGRDEQKLAGLTNAYVKAANKQKVMGEVLDLFTENQVNVLPALAKVLGTTTDQVTKLGSEGKIHFNDLQAALSAMTGEGGKYHNMMAKISKTSEGLWSTFTGNIKLQMGRAGQSIIDAFDLKDTLAAAGQWIGQFWNNYGAQIKDTLSQLADGFATFKDEVWKLLRPFIAVGKALIEWIDNNRETAKSVGIVIGVVAALTIGIAAFNVMVGIATMLLGVLLAPLLIIGVVLAGLAVMFPETFGKFIAAVIDFAQNWDIYFPLMWERFKLWVGNLWEKGRNLFVNLKDIVVWFFTNFVEIAGRGLRNIGKGFENTWDNIKEGWNSTLDWLKGNEWEPDFKSITDGFEDIFAGMPEWAEANTKETNARIEELNKKLADRKKAKDEKDAKDKDDEEDKEDKEELDLRIGGGGGGGGGGGKGKKASFGFFSAQALVERIQKAAGEKNVQAEQLKAAQKGANAQEAVLAMAKGEGLAVKIMDNKAALEPAARFGK